MSLYVAHIDDNNLVDALGEVKQKDPNAIAKRLVYLARKLPNIMRYRFLGVIDGVTLADAADFEETAVVQQSSWDKRRTAKKNQLFQVAVLKALKRSLGANAPAEIDKYIEVYQADTPGSILLEDGQD